MVKLDKTNLPMFIPRKQLIIKKRHKRTTQCYGYHGPRETRTIAGKEKRPLKIKQKSITWLNHRQINKINNHLSAYKKSNFNLFFLVFLTNQLSFDGPD